MKNIEKGVIVKDVDRCRMWTIARGPGLLKVDNHEEDEETYLCRCESQLVTPSVIRFAD